MKKLILLFAALMLPLALFAKTTVVYHTSDTHGFYYPKDGVGGFAALKGFINKGPAQYLLLDGGDFSNGTVEAKNSKGLKSVEMMNAVGYHASTVGNHEFDFYEEGVAPILEKANFSILAANFFEAETNKRPAHVLPYKIFHVDGVDIAVIGIANRYPTKKTKKYKFSKPLEALEQALSEVEKQNPDVVAVIVHDSLQDDKHGTESYVGDIGRQFSGRVHIVFGGHAHKIFQNEYVNKVLFVESGCNIKNVSKVEIITDDKTGKFVSASSELIPLTVEKTGTDAAVEKLGEELREAGVDEIVGKATATLSKRAANKKHADSSLDNWIADLGKAYSGAEVFIHNTGGTRVDMLKGNVTRRDLIDIHPFENTITQVKVTGLFLKKLVKSGLHPWSRFTYSGLTATYKVNKKGKVKRLKIWVNGKKVKNKQTYIIATNSFIAEGGSEGYLFKQIPETDKKQLGTKTIRGLMEDALRQGEVSPVETGRLVQL